MKRIAIFGAKGYLGKQLSFYFTQKGETCDEFDMPECDITDVAFWESFEPTQYKSVLFFAGLTGTEKGFGDATRYVMVNEIGLLNLLNKLSPFGADAPKIVFPSSRLVYKGADRPLKEDDLKETKTVYAVNKLACENYIEAFSNRFDLPFAVLRICVPYGSLTDSDYSYGTLGFFKRQLSSGKSITLFGGGMVKRTFSHVEDICRAVELLMGDLAKGAYNMDGDACSLREVAELFSRRFEGGRVEDVPWPEVDRRLESGSTVFDSTRIKRAGFACRHHIKEIGR